MKTVAHLNHNFFNPSETFVYNYVSSHKKYKSICIADNSLMLNGFYYSRENAYQIHQNRFSKGWFYNKLMNMKHGDSGSKIEILLKRKVNILHAHFGPRGWENLSLKLKTGLPLVTSFYGEDASFIAKSDVWKDRYRELFDKGDVFLAEGPSMRERLIKIGCPDSKIRIQRIAIDLSKLSLESKSKSNSGKTIFIFAGRFVEKKGLLDAIEAISILENDPGDFEFRIIGDGPLRAEIEEKINAKKLQSKIKLLGFLNYDSYISEMKKAHIFLHPSKTATNGDSEGGAPTTILEAQALGLPVISTLHADIPYITVKNKSALLCEEGNLSDLAANIKNMVSMKDRWSEMGAEGRQHVERFHDIRSEIDNLEKVYDVLAD